MNPIHIATGQLPNSEGSLFTVPADTTIVVTHIVLINDSANPDQDVSVLIDRSGTPLELTHAVLESQHVSVQWNGFLVLGATEEILGVASDASSVNYFIDGYEIT